MKPNTISKIYEWLRSPRTYDDIAQNYPNSIMFYDVICNHDDGHMCTCRIDKLIMLINESEKTI